MSSSTSAISENRPVLIALAIVGLLIVAYLVYFFSFSGSLSGSLSDNDKTKIESLEVSVSDTPAEAASSETESNSQVKINPTSETSSGQNEDTPSFILPRLNESDQLIRDGVVSLTRHEGINAWLSPDELIRKVVVLVDNVANGRVAKQAVAVMTPDSGFSAKSVGGKVFVMDNFARYNAVTNILTSIDARRLAELYILLKPLFTEAYGELGYPNANFDDTIFRAIGRLLETPVLNEPARLIRPVVMFEYESERLENLSSAQKQLLRMGPENTQKIQNKLSEIAIELRSVLGR